MQDCNILEEEKSILGACDVHGGKSSDGSLAYRNEQLLELHGFGEDMTWLQMH